MVGCGPEPPPAVGPADAKSDPDQVRSADFSVLYVGNSHTGSHNLPALIAEMIRYRHPDKTVYSHAVSVAFLEDVARDPACREEIESRQWKYVVLQAQKESRTGTVKYSTAEGIEIA